MQTTPTNLLAVLVLGAIGLALLIGLFVAWGRWLETPDPESARAVERMRQQIEWREQFERERRGGESKPHH
jgi:hypothetical protein